MLLARRNQFLELLQPVGVALLQLSDLLRWQGLELLKEVDPPGRIPDDFVAGRLGSDGVHVDEGVELLDGDSAHSRVFTI